MIETIVSKDLKAAEMFIETQIKDKAWEDAEYRHFRASQSAFTFEDLQKAIETISLFSPRIVIVFHFDDQQQVYLTSLEDLLDVVSDQVYLFVVFEKAPKASHSLMKKLKKKGAIHRLDRSNQQGFDAFLKAELEKRSLAIDTVSFKYLKQCFGNRYEQVPQELDKLVLYDTDVLHLEDIQTLIHPPLEEDVFALSNAVSSGDRKESFQIYHDLKKQGVSALQLTGLMASNLRRLLKIAVLYESGYREKSIASLLSLSERQVFFLVKNRLRKSKHFAHLLNGLAEIDQKVKTGLLDEDLAFSTWLIEMTQ